MFEQPFAVPYLDYSYGSPPVYVIYGTLSTNLGLRAQMFYGFRAPDGALPGACCPGLLGARLGSSPPASQPAPGPTRRVVAGCCYRLRGADRVRGLPAR
jgi:hypothetical protein